MCRIERSAGLRRPRRAHQRHRPLARPGAGRADHRAGAWAAQYPPVLEADAAYSVGAFEYRLAAVRGRGCPSVARCLGRLDTPMVISVTIGKMKE